MNLTPENALAVLDAATSPANVGKLTRTDYMNVQMALECLSALVKANTPTVAPKAEPESEKSP